MVVRLRSSLHLLRRYLFLRGTGSRSKTKKKTAQKDPRQKRKMKKKKIEVYQEPSYGYMAHKMWGRWFVVLKTALVALLVLVLQKKTCGFLHSKAKTMGSSSFPSSAHTKPPNLKPAATLCASVYLVFSIYRFCSWSLSHHLVPNQTPLFLFTPLIACLLFLQKAEKASRFASKLQTPKLLIFFSFFSFNGIQ